MGKGIDTLKLKKRSEKLSFMEVKPTTGSGESTFVRLEGFTTQTFNANATEYSRRYVDEDTDRTDVTGYAESINYNFDQYVGQKALEEIVKMVGMDALSPSDRLKMEAARSIREDFLHQNSFHEVDTYTSLRKQFLMMKLVIGFYDNSVEALQQGVSAKQLIAMAVRERIGRFKYTVDENIDAEYEKISNELHTEIANLLGREE